MKWQKDFETLTGQHLNSFTSRQVITYCMSCFLELESPHKLCCYNNKHYVSLSDVLGYYHDFSKESFKTKVFDFLNGKSYDKNANYFLLYFTYISKRRRP